MTVMWSTAQPSAALWNETESRAAVAGTAQENQCVHRTFLPNLTQPNPKLRTATAARPSESCRGLQQSTTRANYSLIFLRI
jgi:hypothetical protein